MVTRAYEDGLLVAFMLVCLCSLPHALPLVATFVCLVCMREELTNRLTSSPSSNTSGDLRRFCFPFFYWIHLFIEQLNKSSIKKPTTR
eukprot:m.256484 g.256484  ORF g.256484 m.256484 type:complete len:88 (+) comp21758_c0_seq1:136-399(+)